MSNEHVILCGGVRPKGSKSAGALALNAWPSAGKVNVRLDILDLNKKFYSTVPGRFYDLLDIATYVYQGDQMFSRGKLDVDNFGSRWRRHLHYHVPVREPDFWNDPAVQRVLRDTLEFLSDDFYDFTFQPGTDAPEIQDYLTFGNTVAGVQPPEMVTLFSGGLDSLGGAVREIIQNKQNVALVNHQSTAKFGRTYDELIKRLRLKADKFQPLHLRVEINKKGIEGKDHYQRARSFLYAALGGTVAMMLGLRELRFYENGILSLNLPICGQLVGARATRTTHPRVMDGFEKLLTLLAREKFAVRTPFLWHTKGEVVKEILKGDCGSLIPFSRSCAHTWQTDNDEPHCGICSQCLDRRLGVLAAEREADDPLDRYHIDIFTQARPKKEDKILGAGYIERANQIAAMRDSSDFLCRYPEVARAIPFIPGQNGAVAEKIFSLYRQHAQETKKAIKRLIGQHAEAILERTLPGDCLLRSVIESGSVTSTPVTPPPSDAEHVNGQRNGEGADAATDKRISLGRLKYLPGFNDVWLDDEPYDLRSRNQARHCIEYLVVQKAFCKETARHLEREIDPYVREKCSLPDAPHSEPKIHHYFNDAKGKLPKLREELIHAAGKNGKYFLKAE
jgi:hypothetical protein